MRNCFYCKNRANSREHVRPDWLKSFLHRSALNHIEVQELVTSAGGSPTTKLRSGDPASRRVKCVCAPCNNGWMSQIQTSMKPVFEALWNNPDGSQRLSIAEQKAWSAWIAMTVIAADQSSPQTAVATRSDGSALKVCGAAPLAWRTFMGVAEPHERFDQRALAFDPHSKLMPGAPHLEGPVNLKLSTYTIGRLIFHCVFGHAKVASIVHELDYLDDFKNELVELRPYGQQLVEWPSNVIMTEKRAERLSNVLFDTVRQRKGL